MKFDFSILAAATALVARPPRPLRTTTITMVTGRATLHKQVLTGNQPTLPQQAIGLRGPMPPRRTGTVSAPALPLRNGHPTPQPHLHTGLPTVLA